MQEKNRIATSLILLSAPIATAHADWAPIADTQGTASDLQAVIVNVVNWILGFIALVAVLMIIWGGVQYLTAAGNADTAKKGKETITRAVIGLAIAGLAYAIVNLVITVVR